MRKSELKTKYKNLVRQGHLSEAEKVLNILRGFSRGIKPSSVAKVTKKNIKQEDNEKDKTFTKEDLLKLSFSELKKLAKKFGETGRSKKGLIRDILKHL